MCESGKPKRCILGTLISDNHGHSVLSYLRFIGGVGLALPPRGHGRLPPVLLGATLGGGGHHILYLGIIDSGGNRGSRLRSHSLTRYFPFDLSETENVEVDNEFKVELEPALTHIHA